MRTGAVCRLRVVMVAITLTFAGCGGPGGSGTGDEPSVVAAFYPLAFVAEQVAGTHASVENLTSLGGEPHDLTLGVRQTAQVGSADLVVYEKGFQAAVDDTVKQHAKGRSLDVVPLVKLLPITGASGKNGSLDTHFWQDPLLMAAVGDHVAEELAKLDELHANDYRRHAAQLRAELEALDEDYQTSLASCARDTIVVNHNAFGYLGKYGLRIEAIAGLSPDAEPTPADLARLREVIADQGITTVFS
jgi:zinc transport system substrate-binding protein